MLGTFKTMTGDQNAQIEALQKKSNRLATIAASSGLTRRQAITAYNIIYMPSMTYSLACSHLSENEPNKIQMNTIESFLPLSDFNKKTPREIVFRDQLSMVASECGICTPSNHAYKLKQYSTHPGYLYIRTGHTHQHKLVAIA
jgi:hypothetical protein